MNLPNYVEKIICRKNSGEVITLDILGRGGYSSARTYQYFKSFDTINDCIVDAPSNERLEKLIDIFGD